MRLGQHLSPSGEKVITRLLHESDEFLDFVNVTWNLRELDVEKVLVNINNEIQTTIWSSARHHRFERELHERFGVLKSVLLHPTVLWLSSVATAAWGDFRVFGDPQISRTGSVILLVFLYKNGASIWVLIFAALALLSVNPAIMVALLLCMTGMARWRKLNARPKGFIPPRLRKMQGSRINASSNSTQNKDSLVKHYKELSTPLGKFDAVVLGSDLGGLVLAGILSCIGWRVLVLEEGPIIGAGALVRVYNKGKRKNHGNSDDDGADLKEFDVGFQPLGRSVAFQILNNILRFRTMEHRGSKLLPSRNEPLHWVRVGFADAYWANTMCNLTGGTNNHYSNNEERKAPFHDDSGNQESNNNVNLMEIPVGWGQAAKKPVFVSEMVRFGDTGSLIPIVSDVSRVCDVITEVVMPPAAITVLNQLMADEALNVARTVSTRSLSCEAVNRAKYFSNLLSPNGVAEENCNALGKTVEDVFKHLSSPEVVKVLSAFFGEENIPNKDLSTGAYSNYFINMISQPSYPIGGLGRILNGLVEVIEQAGGELRTNVPGYRLLCCNANGAVDRDSGGDVAVKGVEIHSSCNSGGKGDGGGIDEPLTVLCPVVVSATGALDTYYRRVKAVDLNDAGGIPTDLQKVHEGRPRCHLLLEFDRNWISLRGSSFRLRIIRNDAAASLDTSEKEQCSSDSPNTTIEWLAINFMEPKDPSIWNRPTTRCVISAELPECCCSRPSHEGSSRLCRPSNDRITNKSRRTIERMQALMLATLHTEFPQTRTAKVLLKHWVEDQLPRLSHTPDRAVASEGLRPHTPIKGLYLCGRDIGPINTEGGAIFGALLAAEAIVGCSTWDYWLGNSFRSDLRNFLTRSA